MTNDSILRVGRYLQRVLGAASGRKRCVTVASEIPAEIACTVFELLCFADRISVTHVCKRWRSIALEHELLWSRIRCTSATFLDAQLERTRRVPVDVQVSNVTRELLDEVLEVVSRHLDHVRLLRLHASPWNPLPLECFPTVYNALAHPAPLMQALDVHLFYDPVFSHDNTATAERGTISSARVVPATLLLGHAPVLQKLTFRGMRLPPDGPSAVSAMQNISRLQLDIQRLSAAQLCAIVALPRLRSLSLEVRHCDEPQAPAPEAFRLDELWISGPYGVPYFSEPCPLLEYLGFPHIRHFTSNDTTLWLETMTSPPRCQPHTLLVEAWTDRYSETYPTQAWRMIDDAGFVSDLVDIVATDHFSWPDAHHMLSYLKELVIHYFELRRADYDLSFDHLTRLCVRMFPVAHEDWATFSIPCPKLRTLELWGGGHLARACPDIMVDEVLNFVQHFLVFDAEHPPELIIREIGVAGGWARLEGLVSSIRREDPAPKSFVVELKSKWHVCVSDE